MMMFFQIYAFRVYTFFLARTRLMIKYGISQIPNAWLSPFLKLKFQTSTPKFRQLLWKNPKPRAPKRRVV